MLALGVTVAVIMITKNNGDQNTADAVKDTAGSVISGLGINEDDPLNYQEYNPFVIDKGTPVESQDWYFNGVLKNVQELPEEKAGDSPIQKRKLTTQEFLKE